MLDSLSSIPVKAPFTHDGKGCFGFGAGLLVVHVVAHQHQAEEGVFQHTLEVDDARALEAGQQCDHRTAKAPF